MNIDGKHDPDFVSNLPPIPGEDKPGPVIEIGYCRHCGKEMPGNLFHVRKGVCYRCGSQPTYFQDDKPL